MMVQVTSSNIAEVGYDDVEEMLFVTFLSGATWRYLNVPLDVYVELLTADSIGSFFARNIRSKYQARPVTTLS